MTEQTFNTKLLDVLKGYGFSDVETNSFIKNFTRKQMAILLMHCVEVGKEQMQKLNKQAREEKAGDGTK